MLFLKKDEIEVEERRPLNYVYRTNCNVNRQIGKSVR